MFRDTARLLARVAFCCAAVLAYVSAVVPRGPDPFGNDKLYHMLAFMALAVLARIGWSRGSAYLIGLGLVAFGAAIEISQALRLVHRDPSWADLLFDMMAVVLGLVTGAMLLDMVLRKSSSHEPL